MKRFCFFLLLFIAACAKPPVEPLQIYPGLDMQLLSEVARMKEQFSSLKSMARVSIHHEGKTSNFSQATILEKPDRIRMDVLSPFGSTFLKMCSDGRTLQLYIPSKGKFYEGAPTPDNFQLLTRMPVDVATLIDLFLYSVPQISESVVAVRARGQDGYVLDLGSAARRQELWFNRDLQLVESYWYLNDSLEARVTYGSLSGNPPFPTEITFEQGLNGASLSVVYSSPQPNADIDQQLFHMDPPQGVVVEPFPGSGFAKD